MATIWAARVTMKAFNFLTRIDQFFNTKLNIESLSYKRATQVALHRPHIQMSSIQWRSAAGHGLTRLVRQLASCPTIVNSIARIKGGCVKRPKLIGQPDVDKNDRKIVKR